MKQLCVEENFIRWPLQLRHFYFRESGQSAVKGSLSIPHRNKRKILQFFIGAYFLQFNFCQSFHFPNWIIFFHLQVKYSNVKMGANRTASVGIFYLFLSSDLKKKICLFPSILHSQNQKNKIMCIKTLKSHFIVPRCSKRPIQFTGSGRNLT